MGKDTLDDLLNFLIPFPAKVQENALWLREFVWGLYPQSNELIYDNYNALAIGFAASDRAGDAFCHIAVYSSYVNFGFNWGSKLSDPKKILIGSGKQSRHITIKDKKDFPKSYIKKLLKEAYQNSLKELKDGKQILKGKTLVKSISDKKRRPK